MDSRAIAIERMGNHFDQQRAYSSKDKSHCLNRLGRSSDSLL